MPKQKDDGESEEVKKLRLEIERLRLENGQLCTKEKRHNEQRRRHAEEIITSCTCKICLEKMQEPTILPCGHTFCCQCLDRAIDGCPKVSEYIHSCIAKL